MLLKKRTIMMYIRNKRANFAAMNILFNHIEHLLLNHPCVIVPQFGAFVTMECASSRADGEEVFFPPLRIVRFNPDLVADDGLLVKSVRETYRLNDGEAKRKIQKAVLDLRQQLLADGQVDFGSIGLFSQDEDGHVSFAACQAGIVTPQFFGLDAFAMSKLSSRQRANAKLQVQRTMPEEEHDSHNITIRISRKVVRYVAATAAAIILGVLFSVPVNEYTQQATVFPTETTSKPATAPAAPKQAKAKAESAQPSSETRLSESANSPMQVENSPKQVEAQVQPNKLEGFCVVLASNVSHRNADRYVADLQERGYSNATIYDNGKMLRVILSGFADESTAAAEKTRLNKLSKEFASAWVMQIH